MGNIVSTRRFGRLGNELYQYAAVIGYAVKHGIEWSMPRVSNDYVWNPIHFPHLHNPKFVDGREDVLINENGHEFQEIKFDPSWEDKQIVLNGYWQSWKYFDHCRDLVLETFDFPYSFDKGVVSIHIRRGDYLLYPDKHPVVTESYLNQAMAIFLLKGYNKFKVFSDDIPWCKGFFKEGIHMFDDGSATKVSFEFSEGKSEVQDLIEMSHCEHNIVSNSTMSVWAAEINRNPAKIVVIPSEDNWFGINNKHLQVKDIYRPEWIQIKY